MSNRRFRDGTDRGARMLSETMRSQIFRESDTDPIWNEYVYVGAANILVPRKRKEETLDKLRMLERDRFVTQLSSPDFQQDLWDFVDSEEFEYLRKKWLANSENSDHRAFQDEIDEEVQVLKALKNVEDLKTPHNSKDFISQVESCMSDIADYSALHEGMVRLFTAKSVMNFVEEIGEDSDRIARAWRMFVHMAKFNGFRKIIKQSNELEERLKLLREQFPNFAHVVDHVIGQLRVWPLKQEDKQRLKPLNLNGPKGTGKSAFAKALAEALNTRYDYVNIASTSMGGVLTGISNKWGNGQAGLIFSSLARSETASPLILLDEIDKADRNSQFPVEGALLALLEPQRVQAVVGMAVPFGGRPRQPAIEIMRQLYAGRFHYILHFQQPGVAEAEMDADIPRTLRMMMHNTSAAVPKDHFLQEKPAGSGLFDGVQDPGTLPAWCDSAAFDHYLKTFEGRGFYGALNWYRNFERNWQRTEALADRQIEQPALFLLGDMDPVGTLEAYTLKQMPKRIARLEQHMLQDCGHWIQNEQAEQVNQLLLGFLGRHYPI